MDSTILIIFGGILLYLFFGIGHTNTLQRSWPAFRKIINKHPVIHAGALIIWPLVYIIYITPQAIKALTKSRRDDWPESEADLYDEKNLPEFLKRQSSHLETDK